MLLISIIFASFYLIKSLSYLNNYNYCCNIDQFMYSGSRLLNGELAWTREFDDKSPVVQFIFAFPALFNSVNFWTILNITVTLISSYYLFLIVNILNKDSYQSNNKKLNLSLSIFISSFYLLLISFFEPTQINILSINFLIISKYYLLKSYFKLSKGKSNLIKNILVSAFFSSIAISIKPYLLIAIILNGIWIPLRLVKIKKIYTKSFQMCLIFISKFFGIWSISLSLFLILINIVPYLFTNNISIFITTLKLNSIEYGSLSVFDTLQNQISFLIKYKFFVGIIGLIYFLGLFILLKFKNKFKKLYKKNKTIFDIYFIDLIFLGVFSPLAIEILILKRHFFVQYYIFFIGYISLVCAINIKMLMQILKPKIIERNLIFVSIILLIFSFNFLKLESQNYNNYSSIKINEFNNLNNFISSEKVKNKKTTFLFPFDDFYHWKLSESKHGFPMSAVFSYISKGQFDRVLEKYPDLEYDYIVTKKEKICSSLLDEGPDLIFLKDPNTISESYIFNCLQNSKRYSIVENQRNLEDINWFLFRSSKNTLERAN